MIFLFFGTFLGLLEAELAPFKDWEKNWQHLRILQTGDDDDNLMLSCDQTFKDGLDLTCS